MIATAVENTKTAWLGAFPAHWEVLRIKNLFQEMDSRSETGSEELLSVSHYTGVTLKRESLENEDDHLSNAASLIGYKKVVKGDLIINIMGAWNGRLGISAFDGITSPAYCVYRLKGDNNPEYFGFLFRTSLFVSEFLKHSAGIGTGYLRLYSDKFFSIYSVVPPKNEQDQIVHYIKAQEEKINRFIEKKLRFIELLKEQRLSIVFKTVTKGLNKDAKLKETGIDWIGKIPSNWDLKRMKYLCKISNGMDCEKDGIGEFPVYGSGGVFGRTDKFLYNKPSVLLGRKGTIDKPLYVTEPFWTVDTAFYTKIFEDVVEPDFFYQICCCIPFESLSTKTALPSMTQTNLYQVKFPVPPIEEQKQIVSHIKTETATIDTAIAKAERETELIREYKEAMIGEAVMGKIL